MNVVGSNVISSFYGQSLSGYCNCITQWQILLGSLQNLMCPYALCVSIAGLIERP